MTWQEVIAPDEAERFEGYARELRALQQTLSQAASSPAPNQWRALHTKGHVGAVGRLEVRAPSELRAGVFASDRAWPVYVRFSNGSPGRAHDGVPDIRGVALKLVGVPGKKLIAPLADALTQDFLFIQTPTVAIKDPDEFMTTVRLAQKGKALLLPRLIGALGFRRAFAIARGFIKMPKLTSFAASPVYTAVPLAIGPDAVKLALVPDPATAASAPRAKAPDQLRQDLVARLAAGPLTWKLMAQRWVSPEATPLEDASRPWSEAASPWLELGRLELPAQAVTSAAGQAIEAAVESFSFDPWHALPEHRPLGAVMRARGPAYRESVIGRGAAPEPTAVLEHAAS